MEQTEKYNIETIKSIIITEFSESEQRLFFDKACNEVLQKSSSILNKEIIEQSYVLDDYNGDGDIDSLIKTLNSFKDDGYIRIEQKWSGYEDYEFLGIKKEMRTLENCVYEFLKTIRPIISRMKKEYKLEMIRQEHISKLRKELYQLEHPQQ